MWPGTTELLLILAVILLIFGGRKIPEFGASLGKGIRNFQRSLRGQDEIDITPSESEKEQDNKKQS
ncbi:MAG: twin-arginine translocase TatA/TatE family subunit [Syntrophotaleaceae bacterium]